MNADRILDGVHSTCFVDEFGIHIVDTALAVTAQAQGVGHVPAAIFTKVESVFPLVRMFWIAVGNDHFGKGESVKDGSNFVFRFVEICNVVQDDPLSVVEAHVDRPILPFDNATFDLKADSFWLSDVKRLEVVSVTTNRLDRSCMIVVGRGFIYRATDFGYVDI